MDLLHSRSHFGFIGLGLIGGSVARCIRRELPDARISAYNYYETKKHPRLERHSQTAYLQILQQIFPAFQTGM